jgi:hypothetical protein
MTVGIVAIQVTQGLPWAEQFNFLESDYTTPTDLTGCTIEAAIRPAQGVAPQTVFGVEITDALSGVALLNLTAIQTAALPIGTSVWDLVIIDRSARQVPVLTGRAEIINNANL